jgi:A/G-specific adenine glycosylase
MSHENFTKLINWSNDQYSHLPWRRDRSLYRTLVSEIMLQQTTVGTVLNHFEKFLLEYPNIFKLAKTSEEQICISWKGLGYYRRARNLRGLAIQIVELHEGKIPTEIDVLLKLKGIGPYTANAIVAIGADLKALAVDANLERVLSRYYGISIPKGPNLQKELFKKFSEQKILTEINRLSSRALNEAFMDLGRILCQARKASCVLCPLKESCHAFKFGDPLDFPKNEIEKVKINFYIKLLRVIVRDNHKILFYRKNEGEWLAGQWELPTFNFETNDEKLKQYPVIKSKKKYLEAESVKTSITKYQIINYFVEMSLVDFEKLTSDIEIKYLFKINNEKLNLSTASIKILKKI